MIGIKKEDKIGGPKMGLTILLVDDDQLLTEKTKKSLNWDELGVGMVFTTIPHLQITT